MAETRVLSDLEFGGLADKALARERGQSENGKTLTISTSTVSAASSAMAAGHWRLVALSAPVHIRFTVSSAPDSATVNDMVIPVGVPIVIRMGASSTESGVTYDAITVRTTAGTGSLYLSPLSY